MYDKEEKDMSVSEKRLKQNFSEFKNRIKDKPKDSSAKKTPNRQYLKELEENAELLELDQYKTME